MLYRCLLRLLQQLKLFAVSIGYKGRQDALSRFSSAPCPPPTTAMADVEKTSSEGSVPAFTKHQASTLLDERRRAALAEVDNAKFSYVP